MPKQWTDAVSEAPEAPRLSVVMPARNVERYIDEAIASVVAQTFADFEFIICDDNSTDATSERVAYWAQTDARIRPYWSDRHNCPARASNWAASIAQGEFIARVDADDIVHPERFARQMAVIAGDPTIAVVGCLADGIDENSRRIYGRDRSVLTSSKAGAPYGHATTIFRRSMFEQIGGYREACKFWEDFDLIYRMSALGRVVYLPDLLYSYRHSASHARVQVDPAIVERALDLRYRCGAALVETGDYESVLTAPVPPVSDRVHPRVFSALAALHATAGNRAHLLLRMARRARVTSIGETLAVIALVVWASIAPRSLRAWQSRQRERNDAACSQRFPDGVPVEWHWSAVRDRPSPASGNDRASRLGQ